MDDFEKKYNKYIKKLKNELSYVLWKEHNNFNFDFKSNFIQGNSFLNIIAILWWISGCVLVSLLETNIILRIIVFVVWIGLGIWYWIYNSKHTVDIADYFFHKYKYHQIIEDRIERDKKQEIEAVLNEMFQKDHLDFTDLDMYKFKIDDIKYFYSRCLSEIKYEQFEEKIR